MATRFSENPVLMSATTPHIGLRLNEALTRVAGVDQQRRSKILAIYSAFTGDGGTEVTATDIGRMSEKWQLVTLERLLDAVKNGQEHFHFNENGVKVQLEFKDLLR